MKLDALRRFALALPDVTEEPHFDKSSFRVRGKIFVTVPPEGTHIHVFVGEAKREPALALHPESIRKLPWGGRIVGLRIDLATCPAADVKALVRAGWEERAPKARRTKSAGETDPLLARLRRLCLSLPETSEVSSWGHPNFRAGKRVFVTYEWLKDRVPTIAFRLDPAEVRRLGKLPGFVATPYGRGQWISLEADRNPPWRKVEELVRAAYRTVALKRMLDALESA